MTQEAMATAPLQLEISTAFTYCHPLGALSPFFRALAEGRLLATRCARCGATFCPPRLLCVCGEPVETWVDTGGGATLRLVTETAPSSRRPGGQSQLRYGLVAVDGCRNLLFARLAGTFSPVPGDRLRLQRRGGAVPPHPIQHAVFEAAEDR